MIVSGIFGRQCKGNLQLVFERTRRLCKFHMNRYSYLSCWVLRFRSSAILYPVSDWQLHKSHAVDKGGTTNATLLIAFYSKQELFLACSLDRNMSCRAGNIWQLPGLLGDFEKQVSSNRLNFYILSLTIVDLLVTGVLIPMRVAQNLAFYNNETVQEPVVRVIGFMGRVRNDCSLYFESSRAYKRSARGLKTSAQVSLCYKVRKKH